MLYATVLPAGGASAVSPPPELAPLNYVLFSATDFANPLVLSGSSGPGSTIICPDPPSEDSVATIVSMGFSRDQAMKALRATVRIKDEITAGLQPYRAVAGNGILREGRCLD